jgi:hydrogenase nickel incorporation protein HypA/HybF
MHELSIALEIIHIASSEAERRGGATVRAIHLRLGPLSGVVKDSLLSAFELACEQSPLASCRLHIEEIPVAGFCETCGEQRAADSQLSICCCQCGQPMREIVRGKELEVAALEIEG